MRTLSPRFILFMLITLISLGMARRTPEAGPVWRVGDKVEVRSSSGQWRPATVIRLEDWRSYGRGFFYRIRIEDSNSAISETTAAPEGLRTRADQTAEQRNLGSGISNCGFWSGHLCLQKV